MEGQFQERPAPPGRTGFGMKRFLMVLGVFAIALGLAWVLEGASIMPPIIPPARLEGHVVLIGNGAFLIAIAAMLMVWANRTPRPKA